MQDSSAATDPPEPFVFEVRVGLPAEHPDGPGGRSWTSGIAKLPVDGPVFIGTTGPDGDGQADLTVHGGVDKAVCVYPVEFYELWSASGHDLAVGTFGENLSVAGLGESDICIGDVFSIGTLEVEVSQPRSPCWKLSRHAGVPKLAALAQENGLTGWYFRVRRTGSVTAGDRLTLLDRPFPRLTVERANRIRYHERHDLDAAAELADCPALSTSWAASLHQRLAGRSSGTPGDDSSRLDP